VLPVKEVSHHSLCIERVSKNSFRIKNYPVPSDISNIGTNITEKGGVIGRIYDGDSHRGMRYASSPYSLSLCTRRCKTPIPADLGV